MSNETKAPQPPAEAQASAPVGVEGLPAKWRAEADEIAANNWACNSNSIRARADELENALAQQPAPVAPVRVDKETERRLIDVAASMLNDNNGKIGKKHFRADATAVVRRVLKALAPQPAADGGFTAADMMDARQEGRREGQQPGAVSLTGVELAQGPDDIPRLLLDGREVATFPAGSWPEVCEAFDFGGYRKEQPAAVDGAMLRKLRDYFEGINNDEDGDGYRNLSADAMDLIDSALAQQGGAE